MKASQAYSSSLTGLMTKNKNSEDLNFLSRFLPNFDAFLVNNDLRMIVTFRTTAFLKT